MEELRVASFFCGCGGMDLGVIGGFSFNKKRYSSTGARIVFSSDIDRKILDIYNANFSHGAVCADIKQLSSSEVPDHDVLTGGFPCQSFSIIAQNPPRLGYKDDNGKLFFEMCRILKDKKPAVFIAENVKGILSANKGKAFPLIVKNFEEAGYHVKYQLLNAMDYGVPQKRQRVFMVGFRNRKDFLNFSFPQATKETVPLVRVINDEDGIPEKYYFSERAVQGMYRVQSKMNKGRAQDIMQPCNTVGAHLSKVSLNSTDPVLNISGRYRRFLPREVARIQSFPDSFLLPTADGVSYKALGNAVPPVMMWHVFKQVRVALAIRSASKSAAT